MKKDTSATSNIRRGQRPRKDTNFEFTPGPDPIPPEVRKAELLEYCKNGGLMGVYYDNYPTERPAGYFDPPPPSHDEKVTAAERERLHRWHSAHGTLARFYELYPAEPPPGKERQRGGRA